MEVLTCNPSISRRPRHVNDLHSRGVDSHLLCRHCRHQDLCHHVRAVLPGHNGDVHLGTVRQADQRTAGEGSGGGDGEGGREGIGRVRKGSKPSWRR